MILKIPHGTSPGFSSGPFSRNYREISSRVSHELFVEEFREISLEVPLKIYFGVSPEIHLRRFLPVLARVLQNLSGMNAGFLKRVFGYISHEILPAISFCVFKLFFVVVMKTSCCDLPEIIRRDFFRRLLSVFYPEPSLKTAPDFFFLVSLFLAWIVHEFFSEYTGTSFDAMEWVCINLNRTEKDGTLCIK